MKSYMSLCQEIIYEFIFYIQINSASVIHTVAYELVNKTMYELMKNIVNSYARNSYKNSCP